ncbi:MAG: hypothetical protein GX556_16665, partial [Fibrobacter sp.]|nr:hypothetical protein [Fibrobacter sp.]
HSTYGLNVKKQINSGTLHFLGHSLNVRNPAGIDFKLRIHHSSVNQITGLLENEISEIDIGESSQLQKDLKELLSWGKSNDNFSKHLYANPHVSGNSESSFFAANIDLSYYDNDFKMQKGLDTKFEKGHEIAFQLNIPGISSVPQSERVYVV